MAKGETADGLWVEIGDPSTEWTDNPTWSTVVEDMKETTDAMKEFLEDQAQPIDGVEFEMVWTSLEWPPKVGGADCTPPKVGGAKVGDFPALCQSGDWQQAEWTTQHGSFQIEWPPYEHELPDEVEEVQQTEPAAELECICEMTAFGPVVDPKCEYHKT
jgi:hypothetical protein